MLSLLDKVGECLNTMQSDSSSLYHCMKSWLSLLNDQDFPDQMKKAIQARYKKGVSEFHVLAYMAFKKPSDPDLTTEEYDRARQYIADTYPSLVMYLAGFEIENYSLFEKSAFSGDIQRLLSPKNIVSMSGK